jgi:hypothetical protein
LAGFADEWPDFKALVAGFGGPKMLPKISPKIFPNLLQEPWDGARDSLDRWKTPVTDELKKSTIAEFKYLWAQHSEATETLATIGPRLNALNTLIQTYGWNREVEEIEQADDWKGFPALAKSKGEKIAQLLTEYFSRNGNQWTRLSELFLHLASNGVMVGGKNPNSTLSAHLSNAGQFESDRSKGWRLKDKALTRDPATTRYKAI